MVSATITFLVWTQFSRIHNVFDDKVRDYCSDYFFYVVFIASIFDFILEDKHEGATNLVTNLGHGIKYARNDLLTIDKYGWKLPDEKLGISTQSVLSGSVYAFGNPQSYTHFNMCVRSNIYNNFLFVYFLISILHETIQMFACSVALFHAL